MAACLAVQLRLHLPLTTFNAIIQIIIILNIITLIIIVVIDIIL